VIALFHLLESEPRELAIAVGNGVPEHRISPSLTDPA
jgi:hypothetical protein